MTISTFSALNAAIRHAVQGNLTDLGKVLDHLARGGLVTATAAEINQIADRSARVQSMTATAAITPGVAAIELNHASVVIAATIADLSAHQGFLMVKNTSASGTAAHTVTVTAGTWNGTNKIITLNAPNEAILVWIDSAGNGTIIENVGAVALSGT